MKRKTKRLWIRPLEAKDFKAWKSAHLTMKKSQNKWDHGPKPEQDLTLEKFKSLLKGQKERREKDLFYDFAIFDSKGSLVGGVAAMEVCRGISYTAYLGYSIFNNYWRLGYGKEAVHAFLNIAFKELRLHRIEAGIEPGNIRSIRLARSLGMRREGLKKKAVFLRNKWVDLIMYTLTSEDRGLKFNTSKLKYKPRS